MLSTTEEVKGISPKAVGMTATFEDLIPNTEYVASAVSVIYGVESEPATINLVTSE